jgi:large subunit ribosomal protein L24
MKQKFSKSWKSSKQPRKQVKYTSNAPLHIKRKFLSSTLDKSLRTQYKLRSIGLRKGDEIKIMRGSFKGKQGKIGKIDIKNSKVQVEGVQRAKAGGEKVQTWFHPSNLKIIQLETTDPRRFKNKTKIETKKAEK